MALNGRVNRLYHLRDVFDLAVSRADDPKTDRSVAKTGIKLARAQRKFNLELSNRRRAAARSGVPLGAATRVPTSTPQFLSLILVEQRRIAAALEQLVGHVARIRDDDDDSDGGGSDLGADENPDDNDSDKENLDDSIEISGVVNSTDEEMEL